MKPFITMVLTAAMVMVSATGIVRADTPDEITVAYFQEWPTANQVAQAERWYDKEMGVAVKWRAFDTGVAMAEAMQAGEVQISYSMGFVPFLVGVSAGNPMKAVGVAVSYSQNDNCVIHNKAAIDKANAHELEGKKVAVAFGTVTHYKLLRVLDALAVDATKVDMIDMVSTEAGKALAAREVTMACGWGGPLRRMYGHGKLLMTAEEQERLGIRVFDVIAVTNDLIDKHPDLVTKFLDVTDQATVYLRRKPDKAKPIIAEAAGMGLKDSNIVLSLFKFPEREDQLSARWMGGGVQAFMQEAAAFFVKQGQMPKALDDYGTTVDSSFYEKVN